jgi:hypothetical protein
VCSADYWIAAGMSYITSCPCHADMQSGDDTEETLYGNVNGSNADNMFMYWESDFILKLISNKPVDSWENLLSTMSLTCFYTVKFSICYILIYF